MGLLVLSCEKSLPKVENIQHSLSMREAFSILNFFYHKKVVFMSHVDDPSPYKCV
jgi:hypothetical protein